MGYTVLNKDQEIVALCTRLQDAVAQVGDICNYNIYSDKHKINIENFKFTERDFGGPYVRIQFGDMYTLSVVLVENVFYEIAVLDQDGKFTRLKDIILPDYDVRCYLTAGQVTTAIIKLYALTGEFPVMVEELELI